MIWLVRSPLDVLMPRTNLTGLKFPNVRCNAPLIWECICYFDSGVLALVFMIHVWRTLFAISLVSSLEAFLCLLLFTFTQLMIYE